MRSCKFLSRFGNDARHRLDLVVFDFRERIAHDRKTTERLCPRAESRQERHLIDEAHRISAAGAVVAHRSRRSCKAARHRSWITLRRSAIRRPRRDGGQECRPLHRARDGRRERRRSDRVAPGESLLPQLATGHVTPLRARINTHGLNRRYASPVRGQGCAPVREDLERFDVPFIDIPFQRASFGWRRRLGTVGRVDDDAPGSMCVRPVTALFEKSTQRDAGDDDPVRVTRRLGVRFVRAWIERGRLKQPFRPAQLGKRRFPTGSQRCIDSAQDGNRQNERRNRIRRADEINLRKRRRQCCRHR